MGKNIKNSKSQFKKIGPKKVKFWTPTILDLVDLEYPKHIYSDSILCPYTMSKFGPNLFISSGDIQIIDPK